MKGKGSIRLAVSACAALSAALALLSGCSRVETGGGSGSPGTASPGKPGVRTALPETRGAAGEHADFLQVFRDGATVEGRSGTATVRVVPIGEIVVTSGRVVACDPIAFPATEPFDRGIAPGRYPVELLVADLGGIRWVAAARIRLAEAAPVSWENAVSARVAGKSPAAGEYYGFPVESGTAGFMDSEARGPLGRMETADPEHYAMNLRDGFHDESTVHWGNRTLVRPSGLNLVAFSSGYGEGLYGSWWGLDAAGNAAWLVTDFGIL